MLDPIQQLTASFKLWQWRVGQLSRSELSLYHSLCCTFKAFAKSIKISHKVRLKKIRRKLVFLKKLMHPVFCLQRLWILSSYLVFGLPNLPPSCQITQLEEECLPIFLLWHFESWIISIIPVGHTWESSPKVDGIIKTDIAVWLDHVLLNQDNLQHCFTDCSKDLKTYIFFNKSSQRMTKIKTMKCMFIFDPTDSKLSMLIVILFSQWRTTSTLCG